jgi:diphthine synthase
MVLYIVGLGLGDEKDITVRGLECVKSCTKLYLEYYTSVLGVDTKKLEEFYGVPITVADREMVESQAEEIYGSALDTNVGFLVVGDPLCATTHVDLILRAKALGIVVEVIHNTSVMGAVASCGLPLYQFGYTVSIPFFEETWRPDSFYDRIKYNNLGGMHTLCLVDIKVKEPDYDSMVTSGRLKYMPPRFMTVNTAVEQILEIEEARKEVRAWSIVRL